MAAGGGDDYQYDGTAVREEPINDGSVLPPVAVTANEISLALETSNTNGWTFVSDPNSDAPLSHWLLLDGTGSPNNGQFSTSASALVQESNQWINQNSENISARTYAHIPTFAVNQAVFVGSSAVEVQNRPWIMPSDEA